MDLPLVLDNTETADRPRAPPAAGGRAWPTPRSRLPGTTTRESGGLGMARLHASQTRADRIRITRDPDRDARLLWTRLVQG
jgi:hypothetical protein